MYNAQKNSIYLSCVTYKNTFELHIMLSHNDSKDITIDHGNWNFGNDPINSNTTHENNSSFETNVSFSIQHKNIDYINNNTNKISNSFNIMILIITSFLILRFT